MKRTTISIPDALIGKIDHKVKIEGYLTITDYIVSLVREDTKGIPVMESKSPGSAVVVHDVTAPHPSQFFPQSTPPFSTDPDTFPKPIIQQPPTPIRIPQTPPTQPLHPKTPARDPNTPDPYLVYGGKCQYKNINSGNVMCLYNASKKLSVAQNQTGDQPLDDQYQEVYLCPDHTSEVSHRSGFFVK